MCLYNICVLVDRSQVIGVSFGQLASGGPAGATGAIGVGALRCATEVEFAFGSALSLRTRCAPSSRGTARTVL